MTTNYTPDEFLHARFAAHPITGSVASKARMDWKWVLPGWYDTGDVTRLSDQKMADAGWVPVRESKGNQARNEQKRIDHIQEQDRIIRRRNEQIAAQVEIIEEVRRDLADYQAMHSQQIETIARLQKNPRPLTADDGMLSRAVLEARKHRGTCDAFHSEVQAIVNAALTEPKPQPEGAAALADAMEDYSRDGLLEEYGLDGLADHLATLGYRKDQS